MKNLKDHVILYDASCPMCELYTKGFQKAGMLDENGRLPYQTAPDNFACNVNQKRSVDEIALVDKTSGKVYYGVESLLTIIVHSFPRLRPLSQNSVFLKCADRLYKFISFNRLVIIPAQKKEMQNPAMNPSFRWEYRLAYIIFSLFVSAHILNQYSQQMTAILPSGGFAREWLICCGQLLWQGAVVSFSKPRKTWDYLGNLMTISLAGSLVLAVVLIFGSIFSIQAPFFYLAAFGATVFLMLLEHIRRSHLLDLGWKLSASWILYRVLVLLIILILNYAA
jgi:predicted DCC family thiol-disulfide oxidoreductase YuxK